MQHRKLRSFLAIAVAAWALLIGPVNAQEWTRFRGPNGTAVSDATTIPATWTPDDYNWKKELPGGSHGSPVLWGDRIFLLSAVEETAQRIVLCLSATDGRILWQKRYETTLHGRHEFNSFASSTPAVDADRVYVNWATPKEYTLMALDHDGNEVWRRDLGPFNGDHASGASPIVHDDMIILANDQQTTAFLLAVDRKTGKTRWKVDRTPTRANYGTPCVLERDGQPAELIFAGTTHGITSIDPRSGRVNWELFDLFDKRVVSSPTIVSGLVIGTCGSGGGGNYAVAVRPGSRDGATAPKLAYQVRRAAPYVPTPVAKGDLLFLWNDKGIVTCLHGPTGKVIWRERVGRDRFFGSPVRVGDRLYCISEDGDVVVVAAEPDFALLGRNPLGELSRATPAVAGGRMYLRTFSHLVSVGGKK